jgi:multidrug efflux pump subunit AcrB
MLNLASKARPYFGAMVLTLALLTAGGVYSYTRMPSGIYPEVTFPRIAVVAHVPGLSVANTEVQVTRPLEQALSTVNGVARVRSKTIRGASEIQIDFNPGTDMLRAEQFTWNKINAARSELELPKGSEMTVDRMTPSINPIVSLVLVGGENATQRRDYAFYQLAPKIKGIPDVLYANVSGGDVREIEVLARPDDLLAAGLSAADLADQIGQRHILQPVARVERPPYAYQVIINTQTQTLRGIEELEITTPNKRPLRVRDVADVKVMHQDRVMSIGFEGKDAVVITVFRSLGGNTVNLSRNLRALLEKEQDPKFKGQPPAGPGRYRLPGNIEAVMVYDQATFVTTSVNNVRDAIIIGGLFSILILMAFLRSWRATLISALAIPTTLAITFLFLHWSGETLNLMSLGGLAVAIGLIIDDTVVVIENIARHLSPGTDRPHGDVAPGADPVDKAAREITGAVVGSTLTTVVVFVPLAFIIGVYGQFFASLTWSLSIAVLVSMVISLTVVPLFAAKFLAGRPMPPPGPIYRFLAHIYEIVLGWALRFHWATLALSLAAVAAGVVLYTGIPNWRATQEEGKPPPAPLMKGLETGLMPTMDEGALVVDYWAPSGTPLQRVEEMAQEIEKILSNNPDVDAYVRRTGSENGLFATQTFRGDITVVLRPAAETPRELLKPVRPPFKDIEKQLKAPGGRDRIREKYRRRPIQDVKDEIEDEIKDSYAEPQLKVELVQIMQDELNDLSGASKPVEIKLFGPDYAVLKDLADKVGDKLEKQGKRQHRGIEEVQSNVRDGNPDLMTYVDGAKAVKLDLSAAALKRQLEAMFLGTVATQVRESALRITDVRVRYPDRVRFGEGEFDQRRVLNQWILLPEDTSGKHTAVSPSFGPLAGPSRAVQLSALAQLKPLRTPDEQWRENQQPAFFVTADLNEKEAGLSSVVADIRRWMGEIQMPAGYHWEIGGHYVYMQQAFGSLLVVMIVAILLVFIMLAFQFRSLVLPLLIFMTQPLSIVSGLFALWLFDVPLNVSSYMGAILLIGLDMKNGILLVEYIQQLRAEGMELMPALIAAGRTRFRPILMTSLAAILGLFPLALGIGPGSQMQRPLAIMVIGGLTANMLFTRMVIPVGYLVLEPKAKKPGAAGGGPAPSPSVPKPSPKGVPT